MKSRFIALCLCFLFVFSAIGCNNNGSNGEVPVLPESDYYLVKDGKTDYTVVIPQNCDRTLVFAAEELAYFFKQATALKIDVKTDAEISAFGDVGYINLGDTVFFRSFNFNDVVDSLGEQGYIVRTQKGNVFIWSESSVGVLYGVYGFLNKELGYECYYKDAFSLEKNVSEKKLLNFNMVDKPDFTYRKTGYTSTVTGDFANRLKMNYNTSFMRVGGAEVHNAIYYIAPAKYESDHPKWYDEGSKNNQLAYRQLCYTAHGDATELAAMRGEVLKTLKSAVRDNPNYKYVAFMQADTSEWCSCFACSQKIRDNGNCKIATLLSFLNPVAKEFKEWMNEVYPDRDVRIVIFAYGPTVDCPAYYDNATKKYKPYTEETALNDNISVYYAPIGADFVSGLNANVNKSFKDNLEKWSALCVDNLCWLYSTIFGDYLDYYNSFDSMQDNYKLLKENGFDFIFDQSQSDATECTGFSRLKMYLNAKLAWDVNADVDKLTKDFFDNYFLDASENMYALFKDMKDTYNSYYANGQISGNVNKTASMKEKGCVSRTKIIAWMKLLENAFTDVEKYKNSDAELYTALRDRITVESVCVRYLYSEVYPALIGEDITDFRKSLKTDLTRLNFNKWWENYNINNLFNQWGV